MGDTQAPSFHRIILQAASRGTWELLETGSLLARLEVTLRELVCWRGGSRKKEPLRGCRWEGAG